MSAQRIGLAAGAVSMSARAADGLIVTGPTGTNVNDLSVVLIRR